MWLNLSILLLVFHTIVYCANLPYTPAQAFLSSNSTAVYLLSPDSDGIQFQLSKIDLASSISTTKTGAVTITSSLPFNNDEFNAQAASINSDDKITLVAGSCHDGATDAQMWTINLADSDSQWTQVTIDTSSIDNPSGNAGINSLTGSIQFNEQMYVFGGMCPNSTSLTEDNWQASGTYSNALLSISSTGTMAQVVTRGPPIAEAGFTITPLNAAYLKSSRTTADQQNFVLIGGQTQSAFINMSQVALLSLPEESWSFTSIDYPLDSITIDPRSGHAAALSNDGKKIYVIGGWVGDVNNAAEPQFLILDVAENYGGSGDWKWTVPDQSPSIPNLYGHSMVMLPGDVLMVSGGYSLPTPTNKMRKRDIASNTANYFFNTSSNSWIQDYTNPNTESTAQDTGSSSGNSSTKIGLGVGLGLGLGLLLILAFCIWFGRRKIRDHRRKRDLRLVQQSMNAANGPRADIPEPAQWMTQRTRNATDPYPWAPAEVDVASLRRASQADRTGVAFDVPSPTRGLRRSLGTRPNSYRYEDVNRSRSGGNIHTIDETDETEKSHVLPDQDIISTAPVLDPFQDPPHLLDRRSPSPTSPAHERELEMQHWYSDWEVAERQQKSGRNSPNKSDRTSSTLSDSNRSAVSALSYQPSLRRDGSKKSTPQISPPDSPIATTHRRKRSKSFGIGSKSPEVASFPQLQAEGHSLLGGPPTSNEATSRPTSRTKSLLGSMRRALAGDRTSYVNPGNQLILPQSSQPQRSSSLGHMTYSQRKQGAQDWGENPSPPKSINDDGEDDWDVESAIEKRVVQVMFTVPKGSLRVVNAGPELDNNSIVDRASIAEVETEAEKPLMSNRGVNEEASEDVKGKARE